MIIPIGSLRHRIAIEMPVLMADGAGGHVEQWQEITRVWSRILPITASERLVTDRLTATTTHTITLRYRNDIAAKMRFRRGNRIYEIIGIVNVEERNRWLRCYCEERDL